MPLGTFAVDIRHWPTLQDFWRHLWAHDPSIAPWARGIVLHHTIKPGLDDWTGRANVERLLRYYRDEVVWTDDQGKRRKGWPAGPHLFIAPDGIWQLTPLNLPGVHANSANAWAWGVEVVGTYDRQGWPPPIAELTLGAMAELLRWRSLPADAATVAPHREFNPTKSCPGKAIDMTIVRGALAARLASDLTFYHAPRISLAQFARVLTRASSPAAASAAAMYEACARRGVDPALLLAFFEHESEYGQRGLCASYDLRNPGNVRRAVDEHRGTLLDIPGRGPFFKFSSWELGAADWAERMRDRYTRALGLATVRRAVPVYAPATDRNNPDAYVADVLASVAQWRKEDPRA